MSNKINRTTFYSYVRRAPFGGRITPQQSEGLEKILNYWEDNYDNGDIRWLAYILATTFHETAATMQPIKERGGEKYLKSKRYYPWYGRGLVQITWEENYKKYGIKNPDDALKWDKALYVLFHGSINGVYTGRKLSHYFNDKIDDPRGARRIINGTDKAGLIADYHTNFLGAIKAAVQEAPPPDVKPEEAQPDSTPITKDPQAIAVAGSGVLTTVIAAVNSPWGVAALVVLVIAGGIGLYLWSRNKEKWVKGV
jgi:putative chitinase